MFKENKAGYKMYISYKIGDNFYASLSSEVRKIINVQSIQDKGEEIGNFIVVEGKEIPVLNLYERLGQEDVTPLENKTVIILKVDYRETYALIGLIVDSVKALFEVYDDQIKYNSLINDSVYCEFVDGDYNYKQSIFKLINIKRVINTDSSIVIKNWNRKRKLVLVN